MEKYPFQIRELGKKEGGGYLITFPDLPGCVSDGDTVDEAIKNGKNAISEWIKARKKWGKEIPVPTPPIDHGGFSGKFIQRVPKSVHAQLAKRAEQEGISMNQLVTSFIVSGLTSANWNISFTMPDEFSGKPGLFMPAPLRRWELKEPSSERETLKKLQDELLRLLCVYFATKEDDFKSGSHIALEEGNQEQTSNKKK